MPFPNHSFNVGINSIEGMITEKIGWQVYWVGSAKKLGHLWNAIRRINNE